MLVRQDGYAVGSLSGGCLEEEVALLARGRDRNRQTKAGFIRHAAALWLQRRDRSLHRTRRQRFPARSRPAFSRPAKLSRRDKFSSAEDKLGSRIVDIGEALPAESFRQRIDPPIQLVVIGGGHDALPFRPLCELLGWQFVEAASIDDAPENLDAWTAAIVKTHHYGRDFAALQKLVPLGLRYLGLIGPRRRRDQLLAELVDITGPIDAELFAPAGLDLGAETPEEIALAVVAEIQSVFAAASAESLRNRKDADSPDQLRFAEKRSRASLGECKTLARSFSRREVHRVSANQNNFCNFATRRCCGAWLMRRRSAVFARHGRHRRGAKPSRAGIDRDKRVARRKQNMGTRDWKFNPRGIARDAHGLSPNQSDRALDLRSAVGRRKNHRRVESAIC